MKTNAKSRQGQSAFAYLKILIPFIVFANTIHIFSQETSDIEEARRFIARGKTAYQTEEYADALKEYKKAQALIPDFPDLYKTIGDIHEKLGSKRDLEFAIKNYEHYLRLSPNAPDKEAISERIAIVEYKYEKQTNTAEKDEKTNKSAQTDTEDYIIIDKFMATTSFETEMGQKLSDGEIMKMLKYHQTEYKLFAEGVRQEQKGKKMFNSGLWMMLGGLGLALIPPLTMMDDNGDVSDIGFVIMCAGVVVEGIGLPLSFWGLGKENAGLKKKRNAVKSYNTNIELKSEIQPELKFGITSGGKLGLVINF